MGKPLDTDLRRRVVAAIEGGMSTRHGHGFGSKLDCHADFLLKLIDKGKDIPLVEMTENLDSECGLSVAPSTLWA